MTEHGGLRRRLDMLVVSIDAGQFREPGDATQAILDTIASIHPPHQDQLRDWLVDIGFLTNPVEFGDVKGTAWFGAPGEPTLYGKTLNDGLIPLYHLPIRPRR